MTQNSAQDNMMDLKNIAKVANVEVTLSAELGRAKLQLKEEQFPLLEQHRQEIFERLNLEYGYVSENPEVRA